MIRLVVGLQHPPTSPLPVLGQESTDSFVLPSQPASGGRVQIGPPSRPFPTTAQPVKTCLTRASYLSHVLWRVLCGSWLASWVSWGHQRMWEVLTWLGKEKYWRYHLAHVDVFQDSSFEICSAGVIGEVGWGLLYWMFSRLQRCGSGFFRTTFILSALLGSFQALRFNCPFLHSENWLLNYFNKYNVDFLCPRSQEWLLLVIWGGVCWFGLV